MARQMISTIFVLAIGLSALLLSSNNVSAQSDLLHRISCDLSGSSVIVRFGRTKHPTNFGVVTPNNKILYLVNPAKGINHLGDAYKKDTLVLRIDDLKGTRLKNDARSDKKVFETAGRYTLLFEDANRAAYEDLHTLSCDFDIPSKSLAQSDAPSENTCTAGASTATAWIADESGMSPGGIRQIGCQATSGCSQFGCCVRNLPGQPCYCSTCCLAKPSGISTRIASTDQR